MTLTHCHLYQFPAGDAIRKETNFLVDAVQALLVHVIEYGFTNEAEMRSLIQKTSEKATRMKAYLNWITAQAIDFVDKLENALDVYKKIYQHPDWHAELRACDELCDAIVRLQNRIYAPAEELEHDEYEGIYIAAATLFR